VGFHILVLAGGSGTRLWPLSRRSTPKHLLPLAPGGETLLRSTLERVTGLADSIRVVTAADQAPGCQSSLTGLGIAGGSVIEEPEARGTGPALALAVALIEREDPDALIASVHADHRVSDRDAYRAAVVASAGWAAATDGLATVGLVPTAPVTGFGYIEVAAPRDPQTWRSPPGIAPEIAEQAAALPAFESAGFKEKPSAEIARNYVDDGRHFWNLGLFSWTARRFRAELKAADPELFATIDRVADARLGGDHDLATRLYSALTLQAVEPLVLERTERLTVVQASFGWSDQGSWLDVGEARAADGDVDRDGNVLEGDVIIASARNCTVVSRSGRIVAVAGVEGIVVIDTPDAVLVIPSDQAQLVKTIVDELRASERDDLL
jgi:mannose-1-phosphate guanylyltransferase